MAPQLAFRSSFVAGQSTRARFWRRRDRATLPPRLSDLRVEPEARLDEDWVEAEFVEDRGWEAPCRCERCVAGARGVDLLDHNWFWARETLARGGVFNPLRLAGWGTARRAQPEPSPERTFGPAEILACIERLVSCPVARDPSDGQLDEDAAILHAHVAARPEEREALVAALLFRPLWIRRPQTWRRGSGRSMLEHLLLVYPVPSFLLGAWRRDAGRLELRWFAWAIALGQGSSLAALTKLARARKTPGEWPRLPKKLPGLLARVPAHLVPVEAVMYAEVLRLGGSGVEFAWLTSDYGYVLDPTLARPSARDFWEGAVRWLARHRAELGEDAAMAVLAWARHVHTERHRRGERFDWAGRSPRAARREAERYAMERSHYRWRPRLRWSGQRWDWELGQGERTWAFVELVTSEQLARESAAMAHCVYGYDRACAEGHSAIFSLRCDGERCLTIEVRLPTKRVVQALGRCNRAARPWEQAVVRQWADRFLRETQRE